MSIFDCFQNDCKFRLECQTTRVFVHVQNIDQKHRSSQHKKCLPFICCYHKWNTVQPTTTMPSCFLQLCIMHFMNPYFVEVQSIHMSSATPVQGVASASKHQVPLHCSCNWKNADLRSWKIVNHSFLFKVSGTSTTKGTERFSSIFAHHLHHTYKSLSVLQF